MTNSPMPVERAQIADNLLPSIVFVAVLITLFGCLLALAAGWARWQVVAGLGGYGVVSAIVALSVRFHPGVGDFGMANQVTLLRAGLVCLAGGALLASGQSLTEGWSLAALVVLALSLDAVDGWVARRFRLSSSFGARFDLEIDALLLLILALLAWRSGRVDAWVLAIGLMRYGFVLAGHTLPWLRAPLPPSRRRQAVCVQQGLTLLLCLLPPVDARTAAVAAVMALVALLASFAVDVYHLARLHRPVPRLRPNLIGTPPTPCFRRAVSRPGAGDLPIG